MRFDLRTVQATYDRRAAGFNRFVRVTSLGRHGDFRRACARALGVRSSERVLDVGCGTGLDFEHLAGTVVGLDLSRGMLREVRRDPRVRLVQADAGRLPFRAEIFDGVLSTYTVSTIDRWREALDEMLRVLRRGRTIVVTDDRLPPGWFLGAGAMLGRLAEVGWSNCEAALGRRLSAACTRVRRGSHLFGLLFWMSGEKAR